MLKIALLSRVNEKENRYQCSLPLCHKLIQLSCNIDLILPNTPLSFDYDALIIPGGDDIDPRYFHQSPHPCTHIVPDYIDAMDFRWAKAYFDQEKPILGICRGFQVLSLLDDGKINQHDPSHINTLHSLIINDGFLKNCTSIYPKNSFHHQTLVQLHQFHISAYSNDGVIEAFEYGKMWAVQWHPELDEKDEILPLFFKHHFQDEIAKNQNSE